MRYPGLLPDDGIPASIVPPSFMNSERAPTDCAEGGFMSSWSREAARGVKVGPNGRVGDVGVAENRGVDSDLPVSSPVAEGAKSAAVQIDSRNFMAASICATPSPMSTTGITSNSNHVPNFEGPSVKLAGSLVSTTA
jgi:hypothetical protein